MVCCLALIEVEILFLSDNSKKDCNEKQENGLLKKPKSFAPYPNQVGIDSKIWNKFKLNLRIIWNIC